MQADTQVGRQKTVATHRQNTWKFSQGNRPNRSSLTYFFWWLDAMADLRSSSMEPSECPDEEESQVIKDIIEIQQERLLG